MSQSLKPFIVRLDMTPITVCPDTRIRACAYNAKDECWEGLLLAPSVPVRQLLPEQGCLRATYVTQGMVVGLEDSEVVFDVLPDRVGGSFVCLIGAKSLGEPSR